MAVKPKVINYRVEGNMCVGVSDKLQKRNNRKEENTFYQSPLRSVFCFLIVNLNTLSFVLTRAEVTVRYWSVC